MVELNQNKNSQQPDWPDSLWKLYFILEINHIQRNCLHVYYKNGCSKSIKKLATKTPSYLAAYEKLI